ncbi:MAG: rRNA maturation RNase YbeY [Candidatus Zixiibacteriota bacterium]
MDESQLFSNQPGQLPEKEARTLADSILQAEKQSLPVNIIFADDTKLAELNQQYRYKEGPTDVLSFPADPDLETLGDIFISIDTAKRQAQDYDATLDEEILRLVCHGTLHLCGYDHIDPGDEKVMKGLEEKYLYEFRRQ